jgi:PAS domain S-box-containing protein
MKYIFSLFDNLSQRGIRFKLIMFALFFCFILLSTTAFILYENTQLSTLNQDITSRRFPSVTAALRMQEGCVITASELRSYVITKNAIHKERRKTAFDQEVILHFELLKNLNKSLNAGEKGELINTLGEQIQKLIQLQEKITLTVEAGATSDEVITLLENDCYPLQKSIHNNLSAFVALEEKGLNAEVARASKINDMQNIFSIIALILALPLTIIATLVLLRNIIVPIEAMRLYINKLSAGELPERMQAGTDEIGQTVAATNVLIDNLGKAAAFSVKIGQGEFDETFKPVSENDVLGNALTEMQARLKSVADADQRRNWTTQGLAQFVEILRNNSNFTQLADNILFNLVKYIQANQGALFILNDNDDNDIYLELVSCYAFNKKKHQEKRIQVGQGMVGQAYLEGQTVYMKAIPKNYVHITSGLGEATPTCLLIVPLKVNDKVEGILEIAAFRTYEKYEIEFVEKLAESIASAIASVKINERTKMLLEESQLQGEQMRAQEEEMRQNMEELQATQEELDRRLAESREATSKFNAILDSAVDGIVAIDERGIIQLANPAMEAMFGYSRTEMEGKNIAMLMPKDVAQHHDGYLSHYRQTGEKRVLAKGREMQGQRKDGSIFPIYLAVNEASINEKRWFTGIIRDITLQKEAENEIKMLLQDSQIKTEELQTNEEELRQNMEEMKALQEDLNKRYKEAQQLGAELNARVSALNKAAILSESDLYGNITYVNDKLLEITGYTREELMGKPHNILRHPDTAKEIFAEMWKTLKAGKVFQGTYKNRKKDGSAYWVEATIAPVLGADGQPEKYVGIRFDITQSREAEAEVKELLAHSQLQTEELRVNEEELRQNMEELKAIQEDLNKRYKEAQHLTSELNARLNVLDNAAIVSEADLFGNITYANDKFCEISGYTREELIGKPHKIVRHPDTPSMVFAAMWETIKQGQIFQGTVKNRKKDGSPYWVEATIAPVLDKNGKPEKYIGIRFDITNQKETQND